MFNKILKNRIKQLEKEVEEKNKNIECLRELNGTYRIAINERDNEIRRLSGELKEEKIKNIRTVTNIEKIGRASCRERV